VAISNGSNSLVKSSASQEFLSLVAKKVEDWNCKFEIFGSYNNDLGFLGRVCFGY
jgi:hypothetical protein